MKRQLERLSDDTISPGVTAKDVREVLKIDPRCCHGFQSVLACPTCTSDLLGIAVDMLKRKRKTR